MYYLTGFMAQESGHRLDTLCPGSHQHEIKSSVTVISSEAHGLLSHPLVVCRIQFCTGEGLRSLLSGWLSVGGTLSSRRQLPLSTMCHSPQHGSVLLQGQENSLILKSTINMFIFSEYFRSYSFCVLLVELYIYSMFNFKKYFNSLKICSAMQL